MASSPNLNQVLHQAAQTAVEAVQNDHGPVPDVKPVAFTINLQNGSSGAPLLGDNLGIVLLVVAVLLIILIAAIGLLVRRRSAQRA